MESAFEFKKKVEVYYPESFVRTDKPLHDMVLDLMDNKEREEEKARREQKKVKRKNYLNHTRERLVETFTDFFNYLSLDSPAGFDIAVNCWRHLTRKDAVAWDDMPEACLPRAKRNASVRKDKKRAQIESFYIILKAISHIKDPSGTKRLRIVDFGSGSGALTLPLAFLFPQYDFIGVDMKPPAIELLIQKARDSSLSNVFGYVGFIEQYKESFDICLGLHACGSATDCIMEMAILHKAAYIVSPCCVGKIKFSIAGGSSYGFTSFHEEGKEQFVICHPRSKWLAGKIPNDEVYSTMAQVRIFF